MKIKSNSTKYDSKRLKQIFSECYNIVKKKEGKLWRWKGLNVEIIKIIVIQVGLIIIINGVVLICY